jgi:K+-sensing histidine kinase KdpD
MGRSPSNAPSAYESVLRSGADRELFEAAGDFLVRGLRVGAPAVVIATPEHRQALSAILDQPDVSQSKLVMLDARETLARICVAGAPDKELFDKVIGGLVRELYAQGGGAPVHAFGEMVDVLWRDGQSAHALRLEELWTELQRRQPLALRKRFSSALEAELQKRAQIEDALRGALRDRTRAEQAYVLASERTERLLLVTAALARAVSAEQVYDAVIASAAGALGASTAGLWVLDPDGKTARLAHASGYTEMHLTQLATLSVDSTTRAPILDVLRDGEPIFIATKTELLEKYPELTRMTSETRPARVWCLPLASSGKVLGGLGLTFEDAAHEDERPFLLLVARYAALALERLSLLETERKAHERTETLYALAARAIRADDVQEVFDAALDTIDRALGAPRCAILVFDADGVMRFKAWRGLSDEYRAAVEGHSPWKRDDGDAKPIVVPDARRDASLASYGALFERERIGALAFIPLVSGDRLLGKFMVYYDAPRALSEDEIAIADAIANHAASAVQRFASIEELKRTVHFNEMFTAILGHDLRNPLGAILTSAQLAARRDQDESLARPLGRIVTASRRMARMIDQLLDFTRLRTGKGIPVTPRPVDIMPLLRQAIDELADANAACKVTVEEASGTTCGMWDSDRLSQVFSNLVANAMRHGVAAAGVRVRVDGTDPDALSIVVHNMGTIPADVMPNLFEAMPGASRAGRGHGLGLGLHITREIVAAHGGTIRAKSSDADGTTFSVTLPRPLQSAD